MAKPTTNFIAWTALAFSIIALSVSLSTTNALNRVADENNQVVEIVKRESPVATIQQQTRDWLSDLNDEITTTQIDDLQIAERISEYRLDLRDQYQTSGEDSQQTWQEIDGQLEVIEENFRSGAATALSNLQTMIEQIEEDIQEDVESEPFN